MTEKAAEVDDFAKAGRERQESYKEFANRLRRLVEVYKVRKLPKHSDVTQSLRMTIPSLALTVMHLVTFTDIPMPNIEPLDFLMEAIPDVHGPDESIAEENEYEVETILNSKIRHRRIFYFVHWKGYPFSDRSWEPADFLVHSQDLLRQHHQDHLDKPGPVLREAQP
ncbi:hypothetical protein EDD11_010266 [Mortierella claussenii]|nr:hypothetical protein EDD11_010266 [Mortierella claussenii]